MGLEAIYPKPRLSLAGKGHRIYPYLLRGVKVERRDQVWSTDITYIPMAFGVHVPDGGDRLVQPVRDRLAACRTRLDGSFEPGGAGGGVEAGASRRSSTPIRGCSSRRRAFTGRLEAAGVAVSMDGRGRALDNVFVERLWRSVKYEDIYIQGYDTVPGLHRGLARYFAFYNDERPHQSLDYRSPAAVYRGTKVEEG